MQSRRKAELEIEGIALESNPWMLHSSAFDAPAE